MEKSRSRKVVLIVFLVFSFLFGSAEAANNNSADTKVIGSIRTAGNRSVTDAQILSQVRSRVGQLFNTTTADEDTKRIAQLSGVQYSYYNTAVADDKIQLTFVVVEKNIVRTLTFVGNQNYKSSLLRKKVGFKVADYIDPITAEAGRNSLLEFYHKKGFAFVEVGLDKEQLSLGKVIYKINEGPRVEIGEIIFKGNSKIKTSTLKKTVKNKQKQFFLWQNYYRKEKVDKDVERLQDIYLERGFLNASIDLRLQFNQDKTRVRLVFAVSEGVVYSLRTITITGNSFFDDDTLRKELKSLQGKTYNGLKAEADVKRITRLYHETGYIDAFVEKNFKYVSTAAKAEPSGPASVDLEFVITEGERFRIGKINITGNEQTQDKVIRRVLDEYDFQPGNWYNADIAQGDGKGYLEYLVKRMTYTQEATITPSGELPGQRDAQVSVIEGQTGSIMLGAGVSTDSGVIGQLIFQQRNFDISDTPENLGEFFTGDAFKGAGQILRIALEPGTEVSQYSISFTEPYFQNKPVSLDVIGSSYERERESYDEKRTKGYFGFEKRYKNKWRRRIGFRGEVVNVGSLDASAPSEITSVKGDNMLMGVNLGFGRDLTNDRFNPSGGYSFDADYEQVFGDYSYGIASGTGRWYKTLYEDLAERRTVLATKLYGAAVIGGEAPPFEKFYAGGQGSLRGFAYRGVSTRGINPVSGKRDEPIGSDWVFLANAEVIVPLASEFISGLFFIDSGAIDSGNYRAAVGTGIQIMLPQWFGPVPMRFEIATPLMKDSEDDAQVFSFSVGTLF